MQKLIEDLKNKKPLALPKAISLAENEPFKAAKLFEPIIKNRKEKIKIGFTGSPGAGKSTLIKSISNKILKEGYKIGIIAVDPSSPFSGGALLGDRLRMNFKNFDPNKIYIRSLSSRGHLGGLSPNTVLCIKLLEYYDYDYILVETVGVGQDEIEIMFYVDIICLVLVAGLGDEIQAIKSGIMEIADIYIVNKCHREGTSKLIAELKNFINFAPKFKEEGNWIPEIFPTEAIESEGIDKLWGRIKNLLKDDKFKQNLEKRKKLQIYNQAYHSIMQFFRNKTLEHLSRYRNQIDINNQEEIINKIIHTIKKEDI